MPEAYTLGGLAARSALFSCFGGTASARCRWYAPDLTDREWALIVPLHPIAKPGGRPRRDIFARLRYCRRRADIQLSPTLRTRLLRLARLPGVSCAFLLARTDFTVMGTAATAMSQHPCG
jgi:hypothetical protein